MEETELVLVVKSPSEQAEALYESLKFFIKLPDFDGAVCATVDPEMFFPDRGRSNFIRRAKAICAQCPAILTCRAFALENNITYGVWGGMTVRERMAIRALIGNDEEDEENAS